MILLETVTNGIRVRVLDYTTALLNNNKLCLNIHYGSMNHGIKISNYLGDVILYYTLDTTNDTDTPTKI